MKPRILFIIHQFRPVASGAEFQAERLGIELVKLGHSVTVLTQWRDPASLREEILDGLRVIRVSFPLAYRVFDWGAIETFRYLVQNRHSYDIIHVHQAFGHAVVAAIVARILGKKCVVKVASTGALADLAVFSAVEHKIFRYVLWILQGVDAFVAISRQMKIELIEKWGIGQRRIFYIPNGVDTVRFSRSTPFPPEGSPRFILVGRRVYIKGIDTVLLSSKILLENGYSSFRIDLYGRDDPECDYRCMADELGISSHVYFHPFTDDIGDVYNHAYCLILPSRVEGLSNVLLEGMAFELPVIASAISGTVDVIDDGVDGILIPPSSPERLAEAMAMLLRDPSRARMLGQNARRKVVERFSLKDIARQYSDLYRKLTGG